MREEFTGLREVQVPNIDSWSRGRVSSRKRDGVDLDLGVVHHTLIRSCDNTQMRLEDEKSVGIHSQRVEILI